MAMTSDIETFRPPRLHKDSIAELTDTMEMTS
jgi:hypothetical protein